MGMNEFLSSQEIKERGEIEERSDNIGYIIEDLKMGSSNIKTVINGLKMFSDMLNKEKNLIVFLRHHGFLNDILACLVSNIELLEKEKLEGDYEFSKILAIQLMCRVLNDEMNCKFISFDVFSILFCSLMEHPSLKTVQKNGKNGKERTVRQRKARLSSSFSSSTSSQTQNNVDPNDIREKTVSMILASIVRVLKNVPVSHKMILKCDTKNTIEHLIPNLVVLLDDRKKLAENQQNILLNDMNNCLKILKFTQFDFSKELKTILPSLLRLLNIFTNSTKVFIYTLKEKHPTVECVFTILNMLTNLTNNNKEAAKVVAYESGIISCMKLIGANLGFSCNKSNVVGTHFDITVNILGLLINLTEHSLSNREELYKSKIMFPNGDKKSLFAWLIDVYKLRESGKKENDEKKVEKKKISLFSMSNKGNSDVEYFILSAYAVLLLGCCVKDHEKNRKTILKLLNWNDFSPFLVVIAQFVDFKSNNNLLFKEELDGIKVIMEEFKKK